MLSTWNLVKCLTPSLDIISHAILLEKLAARQGYGWVGCESPSEWSSIQLAAGHP